MVPASSHASHPPLTRTQDDDQLLSPRSAYKSPPTSSEVEQIVADADQNIFRDTPEDSARLDALDASIPSLRPPLHLPSPQSPGRSRLGSAVSPSAVSHRRGSALLAMSCTLALESFDEIVQQHVADALWAAAHKQHPPTMGPDLVHNPATAELGEADCSAPSSSAPNRSPHQQEPHAALGSSQSLSRRSSAATAATVLAAATAVAARE